ncbi:hemerythrin domain-containing protein [Mangrovivirga sp. M17]|uniref:Hemerythrin domain-containing protein n=1 Tax=Mangrovivirga halotolerans TaxID=2993936 RepID=A0ABT3RS41_9BACT|nr:hemerythrin domain-containing protein [Mangrovivirga halotolerans]MCX2744163.1 hemerythrin domain-containing protein [Mangrovivirga halotolerans]
MNIFETIREDHEKQRTLLDILVKTEGDSEGRREIFEKIDKELINHAEAEEKYFYVPLMQADMTRDKSRHSIAEHHDIEELVEELRETDFSSPGWLATAKKLKHQVIHHLDEEEHEVFQMAGKVLTDAQKNELAASFREMRNRLDSN